MRRYGLRLKTEEEKRDRELWRAAFRAGVRVQGRGLDQGALYALGVTKGVKRGLAGDDLGRWVYDFCGAADVSVPRGWLGESRPFVALV
jgi:hypothetical protein